MYYYNDNGKVYFSSAKSEHHGAEITPTKDQLKYGVIDAAKITELKIIELKKELKQKYDTP